MGHQTRTLAEQLKSYLRLDPQEEAEVMKELQSHLEDRLAEFRDEGLPEDAALKRAGLYFGQPQTIAQQLYEVHNRGTWRDAALAALPALIFSALFASHMWQRWPLVAAIFAVTAGVTLMGWLQGRPFWLFPWVGFCLTPLAIGGYFAANTLIERPWSREMTPQALMGLIASAAYFPPALAILFAATLRAVRRDWVVASLMLMPIAPFAVWVTAVRANGGLLTPNVEIVEGYDQAMSLVLLALAFTSAVFVRIGKRTWKLGLVMVAPLLTLFIVSYSYDDGVAFWPIAGRALLLLALLLSPALLDFSVVRRSPMTFQPYGWPWPRDEHR